MIFVPLFILLFAAWMLWGWVVGETKNIKWLRRWCAPTFVVTVGLIAAGAGAGTSAVIVRKTLKSDFSNLLSVIEMRIRAGDAEEVAEQIRQTDRSGDPDADAFDLLKHVPVMTENLSQDPSRIAQNSDEARLQRYH